MNLSEISNWKYKLSNSQQLGGIETSVLDNGAGRGVRIAWINTGTGLRYRLVLDRGMDILDAFHNQYSLAWISHAGITAPHPFSNQGIDWLRTFGGGLLTTCGLSNAGGPNTDESGSRGLHGNYSNSPAELLSIRQPNISSGDLSFEIVAKVRETTTFGPSLEMLRSISGSIGSPEIRIKDTVTNLGNSPAPHMILYHINCGWPLIDDGTRIVWKGEIVPEGTPGTCTRIGTDFNREYNYTRCAPPLDEHSGYGEDVACIIPASDHVVCGYANDALELGLKITFSKSQMPWLINWQHWGKNEYVTALEPATHPPVGQAKVRENGTLILLEPGESRSYDLKLEVLEGRKVGEFV